VRKRADELVDPSEFGDYRMIALSLALGFLSSPEVRFCLTGTNISVDHRIRLDSQVKHRSFSGGLVATTPKLVDYILNHVQHMMTPPSLIEAILMIKKESQVSYSSPFVGVGMVWYVPPVYQLGPPQQQREGKSVPSSCWPIQESAVFPTLRLH